MLHETAVRPIVRWGQAIQVGKAKQGDASRHKLVACVAGGVEWGVPVMKSEPDEEVWSDASGSWGCGAWWREEWFQSKWDIALRESLARGDGDSIVEREMVTVVVAAAIWGPRWQGRLIRITWL